jgi:16S rRNA (guanine1207-N2)-methyltransferase
MDRAVIETLFSPLLDGEIQVPRVGPSLFLRAQATPHLYVFNNALVCTQGFKPYADALAAMGYAPIDEPLSGKFDLVLLLPSRQRDETRAALVDAAKHVSEHGSILLAGANDEGARSLQRDAMDLFGCVAAASLNKCRAIWSFGKERILNHGLARTWADEMLPRTVPGSTLLSVPGLFSADRVDAGSALLALHLPNDLAGVGADLGAGWGYLSASILRRCQGVSELHLYEADQRALTLARRNLLALTPSSVALEYHWHDVTQGLGRHYDFVISNPPFHIGRADQPEIGRQFIRAAAQALRPGGCFWMVANRHLPYEAELCATFARVEKRAEADGFKVFEAIRGKS